MRRPRGERRPPLGSSSRQIVDQWIHTGRCNVRVRRQVERTVEVWMRGPAFEPAARDVMQQRVHACRSYVGVAFEIERGVEVGMRIAAFEPAGREVVHERVHAGGVRRRGSTGGRTRSRTRDADRVPPARPT